MLPLYVFCGGLFIAFLSYHFCSKSLVRRVVLPLPPGPRSIPFLGNVHQLPMKYQQQTFAQWGSRYGDVVFARLFRTPALVINSLNAAQDLLDKRGSKYSDRPPFILMNELMGWKLATPFMEYGDRWRRHRRWMQFAFRDKASLASYGPLQRRETNVLLSGLLATPCAFSLHLKKFAAALVMEITYGYRIVSFDDEFFKKIENAVQATSEAGNPAATLVDFFHFLKHIPTWMPGAAFKREALRVQSLVEEIRNAAFQHVKDEKACGKARPSFVASLLDEKWPDITSEEQDDMKGAALAIYAAGVETTETVLSTFFLAMMLYPEVFKKAQAEIDSAIGCSRLPGFEDRDVLPYIDLIIKELYRWNPPLPLGVPHRLRTGDNFRGYHIPAGTTIIPNIWHMLHNDQVYREPDTFFPDRFEDANLSPEGLTDPRKIVFGFGRRICPGRQFADDSIWLAIANMIATLDISMPSTPITTQPMQSALFQSGFSSHPFEFHCSIQPRSAEVIGLVSEMAHMTST